MTQKVTVSSWARSIRIGAPFADEHRSAVALFQPKNRRLEKHQVAESVATALTAADLFNCSSVQRCQFCYLTIIQCIGLIHEVVTRDCDLVGKWP